jgi:cytochrome c biogenesis protein
MKSFIEFFSSVKLAIVLLIIITLSSMLGTLIPQMMSPDEYAARFGQLANLLNRLQLTRLYKSWWFVFLLFLFAMNIIVCTLKRLSPKLRKTFKPRIAIEEKEISVLKIKEKLKKSLSLAETKEELKKELSSRHYRVREVEKENKTFLLARKRILGWFGADLVHLGLLTIIVGGIISGIGGLKRSLTFMEGDVLDIPRAEFKLRLDKFDTEFYPNGAVKDWKSTLIVLEQDNPVLQKIIEVNHPLSYKGYVFYQSGWGWNWAHLGVELWVRKGKDPSYLKKIQLNVGERIRLEEENTEVSVLQFIPDFVISEKGQIATRSLEPNNPAAFIEGWEGEEKIFSGWIFAKFPDIDRIHSSKETELRFELKDFKASQYSVIQASRDPGVNFIWVGCTLAMVGLFFAFYWPTREIKAVLEEVKNKTGITIGGLASKSREAFMSEFEKITKSLRKLK